ncbi:hypothetical protein EYB45_07920 [Erythrobacteraceae bacterium CFH 75059]|nr:hypothetical protein EYB45_07920 [Erythrobacteraceae bacterium CFH 75059]
MLVLLLVVFLGAKVHRAIAANLDSRIAVIRSQLEEAKVLRAEAEALRDEYAGKLAGAEADAAALIARAEHEAAVILDKARADGDDMVARRQRLAEERIAGAEREAVDALRTRAATAAAEASRLLIASRRDETTERRLADDLIASL